jgi:hypothetical protein
MRSGSHVQLAALRNRELELQTTSPFSNHGSVERQVVMVQFLSIFFFISTIFVGFFKSSRFFVPPCTTVSSFYIHYIFKNTILIAVCATHMISISCKNTVTIHELILWYSVLYFVLNIGIEPPTVSISTEACCSDMGLHLCTLLCFKYWYWAPYG